MRIEPSTCTLEVDKSGALTYYAMGAIAQQLSLNVSKTRLMMFYMPQKKCSFSEIIICNLNIEEVDHFNFLGLIIDKNMKWHTHVQKVANKIRNVNGILHKFKYVFPHRILIYTSLIESHINYCILLWGTNYDKIFKLQKQAIRTISMNHFKAHTSPLFKSMNLLAFSPPPNQRELPTPL